MCDSRRPPLKPLPAHAQQSGAYNFDALSGDVQAYPQSSVRDSGASSQVPGSLGGFPSWDDPGKQSKRMRQISACVLDQVFREVSQRHSSSGDDSPDHIPVKEIPSLHEGAARDIEVHAPHNACKLVIQQVIPGKVEYFHQEGEQYEARKENKVSWVGSAEPVWNLWRMVPDSEVSSYSHIPDGLIAENDAKLSATSYQTASNTVFPTGQGVAQLGAGNLSEAYLPVQQRDNFDIQYPSGNRALGHPGSSDRGGDASSLPVTGATDDVVPRKRHLVNSSGTGIELHSPTSLDVSGKPVSRAPSPTPSSKKARKRQRVRSSATGVEAHRAAVLELSGKSIPPEVSPVPSSERTESESRSSSKHESSQGADSDETSVYRPSRNARSHNSSEPISKQRRNPRLARKGIGKQSTSRNLVLKLKIVQTREGSGPNLKYVKKDTQAPTECLSQRDGRDMMVLESSNIPEGPRRMAPESLVDNSAGHLRHEIGVSCNNLKEGPIFPTNDPEMSQNDAFQCSAYQRKRPETNLDGEASERPVGIESSQHLTSINSIDAGDLQKNSVESGGTRESKCLKTAVGNVVHNRTLADSSEAVQGSQPGTGNKSSGLRRSKRLKTVTSKFSRARTPADNDHDAAQGLDRKQSTEPNDLKRSRRSKVVKLTFSLTGTRAEVDNAQRLDKKKSTEPSALRRSGRLKAAKRKLSFFQPLADSDNDSIQGSHGSRRAVPDVAWSKRLKLEKSRYVYSRTPAESDDEASDDLAVTSCGERDKEEMEKLVSVSNIMPGCPGPRIRTTCVDSYWVSTLTELEKAAFDRMSKLIGASAEVCSKTGSLGSGRDLDVFRVGADQESETDSEEEGLRRSLRIARQVQMPKTSSIESAFPEKPCIRLGQRREKNEDRATRARPRPREKIDAESWCFVLLDELSENDRVPVWDTLSQKRRLSSTAPKRRNWNAYVLLNPSVDVYQGQDLSEGELEKVEGYCELFEPGIWVLVRRAAPQRRMVSVPTKVRDTEDLSDLSGGEDLSSLDSSLGYAKTDAEGPRGVVKATSIPVSPTLDIMNVFEVDFRKDPKKNGRLPLGSSDTSFHNYFSRTLCGTGVRGIHEEELAMCIDEFKVYLREFKFYSEIMELHAQAGALGGLDYLQTCLRAGTYSYYATLLLDRLECLDPYGVMGIVDCDIGIPDVWRIREQVQDGTIWMSGVVAACWKNLCAALLEYHPAGTLRYAEIMEIFDKTNRITESFKSMHRQLLREEAVLYDLCKLAMKIRRDGGAPARRSNRRGQELQTMAEEEIPERLRIRLSSMRWSDRSSFTSSPARLWKGYTRVGRRASVSRLGPFGNVSNHRDRDGKGHSVFAKRLSAAVLAPRIVAPRVLRPHRLPNGDLDVRKSYLSTSAPDACCCHLCGENLQKVFEDALICSNYVYGLCRNVTCRLCATSDLAFSSAQFIDMRDACSWICTHCTSSCPPKSVCRRSSPGRPVFTNAKSSYILRWAHPVDSLAKVSISMACRNRDGTYGPFCRPMSMVRGREGYFLVSGRFPLGKYRCRVLLNNYWIASFEVCICATGSCPSCCSQRYLPKNLRLPKISLDKSCTSCHRLAQDREEKKSRSRAPFLPGQYPQSGVGWDAIDAGYLTGRRRLLWKVLRGRRVKRKSGGQERIHIGNSLGNTCSRVGVYAWRNAKRKTSTAYVPYIVGEAAQQTRHLEMHRWSELNLSQDELRHRELREKNSRWLVTGKSKIHGIGLFTLTPLERGSFVIEYAGELIRNSVADLRESRYEAEGLGTYFFRLGDNEIVDATIRSSRARFLNHSCDPNLESKIVKIGTKETIMFVAKRYIEKYSELTFDYKLPIEEKKLDCLCNSWACKGYLN